MQYTIDNGILCVTAETSGAQLVAVKYNGKERLWQNATGDWSGRAPLLFPLCGHFSLTHNGISYPIKAHGFAKQSEFTLSERGADFLKFTLRSNTETRAVYPFDFVFSMVYRIRGGVLSLEHEIENVGDTPLFFACGGHESFALDTNVEDYAIEFEKEEELVHLPHDADGYLTGESVPFGKRSFFPLPAEYLTNNDTIILKNIRSRKVWLCEKEGGRLAEISFDEEFGNLLLWRAEHAPFLCVEPWTNLPDPADGSAEKQEFSSKAGVLKVEAGQKRTLRRAIGYL